MSLLYWSVKFQPSNLGVIKRAHIGGLNTSLMCMLRVVAAAEAVH